MKMKEKLIVTESWSTKKKFFVVISFVSIVFLLTWTFYFSIHEYQKQNISNLQDKIYLLNKEISTLNNKLENSNNINNKLEDSIKLINKNFEKFKQAILVDQMENQELKQKIKDLNVTISSLESDIYFFKKVTNAKFDEIYIDNVKLFKTNKKSNYRYSFTIYINKKNVKPTNIGYSLNLKFKDDEKFNIVSSSDLKGNNYKFKKIKFTYFKRETGYINIDSKNSPVEMMIDVKSKKHNFKKTFQWSKLLDKKVMVSK